MDVINNYIIAKYKDNEYGSFRMFCLKLNIEEIKIYDKIDLYKCYTSILKYQIKKYGNALNNSYGSMKNYKYECTKARVRKYQRRLR